MDRTEARKAARFLQREGHHAVRIVEYLAERDRPSEIVIQSSNRCWVDRTYNSYADAVQDNPSRGA